MLLDCSIKRVTFYEDRAEVERRGQVTLAGGRAHLRVEGLTPLLVNDSVRIEVPPGVVVRSQSVVREFLPQRGDPEQVGKLVVQSTISCFGQHQQVADGTTSCEQLQNVFQDWLSSRRQCSLEQLAEWSLCLPPLVEEQLDAQVRLHLAEEERDRASADLAARETDLKNCQEQKLEIQSCVEFELEGSLEGPLEVSIRYWTACALWRPEYLADLRDDKLSLQLYAVLWQNTGESWHDVECRVATGRPSPWADPPATTVSKVGLRHKDPEERKPVVVHEVEDHQPQGDRVQVLAYALEDNGKALTMDGRRRVSLASSSRPTRVALGATRLDCSQSGWAYPELSQGVHRRVEAEHDGFGRNWPLLAGPVRYLGGGLTRLGYCAPGQRFSLSLGLEEGLTVERQHQVNSDVVPITGTQRATAKVQVQVHNLTEESCQIRVRERVPVAEIQEIKISLLSAPEGHEFNAKTGFVDCLLDLEPFQSVPLEFVYRIYATPQVEFV